MSVTLDFCRWKFPNHQYEIVISFFFCECGPNPHQLADISEIRGFYRLFHNRISAHHALFSACIPSSPTFLLHRPPFIIRWLYHQMVWLTVGLHPSEVMSNELMKSRGRGGWGGENKREEKMRKRAGNGEDESKLRWIDWLGEWARGMFKYFSPVL